MTPDTQFKKAFFIVNNFAGKGFDPTLDGRIISFCQDRDIECTLEFTQGKGHATELARLAAASGEFDGIIAVGGDGTLNEVAQGLNHQNVPMGIIARGSGNGLARHLGIPLTLEGALRVIGNHYVVPVDTFVFNGRLSLNVSGLGFDGHIANRFAFESKRGFWGYLRLVANEFRDFSEFDVHLKMPDGELRLPAFICAIANSSQYGNNATIAPQASLTDGNLAVTVLRKVHPWRIDFFIRLFTGTLTSGKELTFLTNSSRLSIHIDKAVPYHVDGEGCGNASEFTVELNRASLPLMVPLRRQQI